MQLISTIVELRARLAQERNIAFVPTMGNLHEGHLDLVRQAREQGSCVVVSIFVNPLQFGPSEDFDKYPRSLDDDTVQLEGLADVIFAPSVSEMYPQAQTVFVAPPPVANELCGAMRPGHFIGMATVVLKLFNIVQPNIALFGKKDYQQLYIIRQMAAQMNLPVTIFGGETIRAADGLALSSRNQYLSPEGRIEAPFLRKTLEQMRDLILAGAKDYSALESAAVAGLGKRGWLVEYVSIRNADSLSPVQAGERNLVVLAAARLGVTRLIDNLEFCL
ncbi:MAG: pantoate--beta-alanine ligase [Gallionellaceae bacterium]